MSYIPFTNREETHCSPFYSFSIKIAENKSPETNPMEFQGDEIFKKEDYRLRIASVNNDKYYSHLSEKSLSSDSEGILFC